jgi:biotin carboxyl carrier protein
MEAMKLENEITATKAGRIEKVLVKPSDVVNQDQELVRIGE